MAWMVSGFHKAKDRLSARIIHVGPQLQPVAGSLDSLPNEERAKNNFSWENYRPHKSLKDRLSSVFMMESSDNAMGGAAERPDDNELLKTIEQASYPIDDDMNIEARVFSRQCWEQAIRYYDAILALMSRRGLFTDHTLIVPASGVDAFMAYYAPTIAIDHEELGNPALDLAVRETKRPREAYAKNFGFKFGSAFRPEHFSEDIHTPHKTMFLKGTYGYLKISDGRVESYVDDLDQFLNPGDRVILLLQEDRIVMEPELRRRGWTRLENWLPADEMSRLRIAIHRMATDSKNRSARGELGYALSFFEIPTDIIVYEKPAHAKLGVAYEPLWHVLNPLALMRDDVFLDIGYARGLYAEAAAKVVKHAMAVFPRSSVETRLGAAVSVARTFLEVPSSSVDKLASVDWDHMSSADALSFARQTFRVIAKYRTQTGWESGLVHFRTHDWATEKDNWIKRFREAAPGAEIEVLSHPSEIGGIVFRWRMASNLQIKVDLQEQPLETIEIQAGSSSRSRIESTVPIYVETSPWGWSRWDDLASHYVLVQGQEARPMVEGQKLTRFNEETKQYEALVAQYLKNELVWIRMAVGQTIEEAEQRVTVTHQNDYAWYYEQHVNTQVDQREVVYVRLYKFDMTWLRRFVTWGLHRMMSKPPELLITGTVSAIEPFLLDHVGWSWSSLVASAGFGVAHTGRPKGFQVLAAAWGLGVMYGFYASPMDFWHTYPIIVAAQFAVNLFLHYAPKRYPNLLNPKMALQYLRAA